MTTIDNISFQGIHDDYRVPYICSDEPFEYVCDGEEGYITFDGYYYVENHAPPYPEDSDLENSGRYPEWLPKTMNMIYVKREEAPPSKVIEETVYTIEIYKKIIHKSTNRISQIEDDDGEVMNVCFFPTNKQTIYFRILETLK